jgi:hypothetical protein
MVELCPKLIDNIFLFRESAGAKEEVSAILKYGAWRG